MPASFKAAGKSVRMKRRVTFPLPASFDTMAGVTIASFASVGLRVAVAPTRRQRVAIDARLCGHQGVGLFAKMCAAYKLCGLFAKQLPWVLV